MEKKVNFVSILLKATLETEYPSTLWSLFTVVPKITFRGTKFGLDAYTYHFQVIVHSQASPAQQSRNAIRAKTYLDNKKDKMKKHHLKALNLASPIERVLRYVSFFPHGGNSLLAKLFTQVTQKITSEDWNRHFLSFHIGTITLK